MQASSNLTIEKTGRRSESDGGMDYEVHELEICGLHSTIEENERLPDDCESYGGRSDPTCSEEVFLDPFLDEYGIQITAHGDVGLSGSLTNNIGIEGGPAYEEGDDKIIDKDDPDVGTFMDLVALALTRSHPVGATGLSALSVAKSLVESGSKYDTSRTEELRWTTGGSPKTPCYATNHRNIEAWVPKGGGNYKGEITVSAFTKSEGTVYGGYLDISASKRISLKNELR